MDLAALQKILSALSGARIACVGDLMVDRFVYGDVTRVSPEAPIPVLARKRELVILIKPTIIRNDSSWRDDLVETQNRLRQLDPRRPGQE